MPPVETAPTYATTAHAEYLTTTTVSQASATVVVPTISCQRNPAGKLLGDAARVTLYDVVQATPKKYGTASAEVRFYCDGQTPTYASELTVNVNNSTSDLRVFLPAGVPVRPGDVVELQVTATKRAQVETITNLTTGRRSTERGPGFVASRATTIGLSALIGNGKGELLITGTLTELTTKVITTRRVLTILPGPAASTPVPFEDVVVNGAPLSQLKTLTGYYWTTNGKSTGTTLASPSPIFDGTNFTVTVEQEG